MEKQLCYKVIAMPNAILMVIFKWWVSQMDLAGVNFAVNMVWWIRNIIN